MGVVEIVDVKVLRLQGYLLLSKCKWDNFTMNFETILEEVGSFGLYQKLVICAVILPANLPCAFHAYRYPERSKYIGILRIHYLL